jgi:hypothetical protein
VAIVGPDQKIHLRRVEVAGDFASEIGIAVGIEDADKVVVNPGDRMSDALEVEILQEQPAKALASKHAAKSS